MLRGIPQPWEAALLALGAYRIVRLIGWDEWPPAARARAWLIGEHWIPSDADPDELGLPGKQPSSEVSDIRPAYSRPLFAHLIHCPWCLGWWTSLATYLAWLAAGGWALAVLAPFAISTAIGLIARNLDP